MMAARLTFKEWAESTPDEAGGCMGETMWYKNNNRFPVKTNDVKWHPYALRRDGHMVSKTMFPIPKKLSIRV